MHSLATLHWRTNFYLSFAKYPPETTYHTSVLTDLHWRGGGGSRRSAIPKDDVLKAAFIRVGAQAVAIIRRATWRTQLPPASTCSSSKSTQPQLSCPFVRNNAIEKEDPVFIIISP